MHAQDSMNTHRNMNVTPAQRELKAPIAKKMIFQAANEPVW